MNPPTGAHDVGYRSRARTGHKFRPTLGFAEFASREYPRLVGALSLHCHDRQVAEEFAQEALVRAADRWTRVSAMGAPGAWVHRVGMNLATSWLRRRQAERRAHARAGADGGPAPTADLADAIVVREAVLVCPPGSAPCSGCVTTRTCRWPRPRRPWVLSEDAVKAHTRRAVAALRGHLAPLTPSEAGDD